MNSGKCGSLSHGGDGDGDGAASMGIPPRDSSGLSLARPRNTSLVEMAAWERADLGIDKAANGSLKLNGCHNRQGRRPRPRVRFLMAWTSRI